MKILKNANIIIIKGKDRGKIGKVKKVLPSLGKVIIIGLNKYKKNLKPTKKNPHGGIVDIDMPIRIENVAIVCSSCNKSTKIGYKITKDKKVRICKKCKQSIVI